MGKIYFASDFHLGVPAKTSTLDREKLIIQWLDEIKHDADELYLLGDVFDFWFDYKKVIPKGFIRLLGKLAELRDKGILIYFFSGNHDLWMRDYLQEQLQIKIIHKPIIKELQSKKFYLAHGDGLGPGDYGYKFIKKIFRNPFAQWLFRWIHPDIGISIATFFSGKSRESQNPIQEFLGADKEWLIHYVESICEKEKIDYFVFGHRHLPIEHILKNKTSRYINLGDWLYFQSFAVLENGQLKLMFYKNPDGKIYP